MTTDILLSKVIEGFLKQKKTAMPGEKQSSQTCRAVNSSIPYSVVAQIIAQVRTFYLAFCFSIFAFLKLYTPSERWQIISLTHTQY